MISKILCENNQIHWRYNSLTVSSWANRFDLYCWSVVKKRHLLLACLVFANGWYAFKKKCLFKGWLWITKGLSASLPLTKPQAELCVLYLLILSFQISLKCQHAVCLETRAVTHNLPFWFVWPILCKAKAYIMNTGICYVPVSCLDLDLETCFQFIAKEMNCHQKWYAGLSEIKKKKKRKALIDH